MLEEDEIRKAPVTTLGELFADGSAIDLLRHDRLVLWSEGKEQVELLLQHQGQSYLPGSLDPKLEEVLRLPPTMARLESLETLVDQLIDCIAGYVELNEATLLLLAGFVLSTWVVECLPCAPVLNLWGAPGTETNVVDLLSCLCRRPLRLFEASVQALAELPRGLCPTVIVKQANERALLRLVAAASEPEVQLLRKGVPINVRCAIVACTQSPLPGSVLSLAMLPPAKHVPVRAQSQRLAEEFQPRLLGYRLAQHLPVTNSDFDCPRFAPESRQLARILGAAVAGAPALQDRIAAALEALDEQCRVERSQSQDSMVLEACSYSATRTSRPPMCSRSQS